MGLLNKKEGSMQSKVFKDGIIFNEDCLKVMDGLIAKGVKVDAIITDPPYNIAKDNNFTTMGRQGIDFGEWDKDADIISWITKAKDLLNKNGSIFIFTDWKKISYIVEALESNNFEVKDLFRYIKANPMPRNRDRRYITDFEIAIWAVNKGAKWTFNRQDKSYQRPEYRCSIETKHAHPTQKPLDLMMEIIKIHTNEGDCVYDGFCGSGTTLVACQNLKRKFIGCEFNPEKSKMGGEYIDPDKYYKIAIKRLSENEKLLTNKK